MAKTKNNAPKEPVKKLSLLNAAASVLGRSDEPMTVKRMIEKAIAERIWEPCGGKTPELTLYSAILREIKTKGATSRFEKVARGQFKLHTA